MTEADEIARLNRIVAVLAAAYFGRAMGTDREFRQLKATADREAAELFAQVKPSAAD